MMVLAVSLAVLFGLTAVGAFLLYSSARRELHALDGVRAQLEDIAENSDFSSRVQVDSHQAHVVPVAGAVNHLLGKLTTGGHQLQANQLLFQRLVEAVHEAVVLYRQTILFANSRFAALTGLAPEQLIGRALHDLVPQEYADLVRESIRRRLAGEPSPERFEVELVGAQGQVSRLELATSLIDIPGEPVLLVTAVEMVPRRLASAPEQERSRALATLQSIGEGIITTDKRGRIDYMNEAAEKLTGVGSVQAMGSTVDSVAKLVDETERKPLGDPVRECLATGIRVNLTARKALLVARDTGQEHSVELSVSPLRSQHGELVGVVAVLHDVTEQRGLARQMSYQASHDALTGLVNRREFERRLEEALESARGGQSKHILCYLDLDRFKAVNDSCGHQAGDGMLREVAALLKNAVRDSDTVARIGGDEFALLLVGCPLEKGRQIADDVGRAVRDYRFVWKDKIFNIDVSIGLIEIGRESGNVEEVMGAADSACYVAKQQGSRVHIYSVRDESMARHRGEIHWLQKLQNALKENRFELYAQPIVSAKTANGHGAALGASIGNANGNKDGNGKVGNGNGNGEDDEIQAPSLEVLVRLKDESGHDVAPAEFLRAAERYRLISLVDRWVVQTTLAAIGRGAINLRANRSVAINISGQTLADTQFLEFVVDCFDRTGVSPTRICFEVTENSVINNLEHARRFIGVLHGMGCKFALDDFGQGMGSFSHLKQLTMDFLKIDGSFTKNLARDSVNQAMVTAMIKMARSLDFKVVAEQIEDEAGLEAARNMGVDYIQGYVTGRPQPLLAAVG